MLLFNRAMICDLIRLFTARTAVLPLTRTRIVNSSMACDWVSWAHMEKPARLNGNYTCLSGFNTRKSEKKNTKRRKRCHHYRRRRRCRMPNREIVGCVNGQLRANNITNNTQSTNQIICGHWTIGQMCIRVYFCIAFHLISIYEWSSSGEHA